MVKGAAVGRVAVRAAFAFVGVAVALFVVDRAARELDVAGVRHPEQVMRYRNEATVPRIWGADGQPALDGVLFRHEPGLELDLETHVLRTNALGLRGPEVAVPKPDGTYRVLVLGDSVVYGWGVDDDVTFVRRMERELDRPARRVEVVNAGHLMFDTVQQAALLDEIGDVVQPDLVLLVYVVNDVEPTRDLVEDLLGLPRPPDPALDVPPERPDVWARIANAIEGPLPTLARLAQLQSDQSERYAEVLARHGGVWAPEEHGSGPRGWKRSREALLRIQGWCDERGVPFLVLDHSYPAIRALPPFCAEVGIDLAPFAFTDAEQELPIRNSAMDSHANAHGHTLLLGKALAALRERGLPPGDG